MTAPAVNEIGAAWDRHYGNTGLSELDRMVIIADDLFRARAQVATLQGFMTSDRATIAGLRDSLALKDEAIALLRDCLAEAEHELDALRERLERQPA